MLRTLRPSNKKVAKKPNLHFLGNLKKVPNLGIYFYL